MRRPVKATLLPVFHVKDELKAIRLAQKSVQERLGHSQGVVKRDCLSSGEIFFAAVDLFSEGRGRGGEERISACGGGWSRRGWEDKKNTDR